MMLSAGNGFIMQSEKYSRDNAGQSLKKYILLQQGELAYNHGASKAKQFGCCYELTVPEARIPYVYHCFKIDGHEYTPYIAIALNNTKMDKQLKRLVSSSVRMDGLLNISFEDYMSVTLHLPTSNEQKRIADFLQKIDERIAVQEKLLASLKKYKRGLLRAIFTREVLLSNSATWERRKFREIASQRRAKYTPSRADSRVCVELEHIEQQTGRLINHVDSAEQSSTKSVFKKGDVLFGKLRPYLRKYCLPQFDGVCSSEIWVLVPETCVVSGYLFYLVQSDEFLAAANISSGTKMPRAEWSKVSNEDYFIPPISEQKRIARMLSVVDHRIITASEMLSTLERMRKSFLQQVFI